MQYKTSSKEKDDLKYILRESDGYKASLKTESSKKNTLSHTTTSDKTLETNLPIFQYQRHSWTQREIYKLPPSLAPYSVVLARMLAYTNPVVFKTTLKEGRGEGRYYRSSLRGFIKNNRKIRACFQFVSSGFCSRLLVTQLFQHFNSVYYIVYTVIPSMADSYSHETKRKKWCHNDFALQMSI